jgi:glucose/arabinose dehydrogenase
MIVEFASHTLLLETDSAGAAAGMLVGAGPLSNVDLTARDPASGRSQIRRFVFPTITPAVFPPIPSPWAGGQVIAYGLRNPAGFAFPTGPSITPVGRKSLYVAENGASLDNVLGFTPKFANDNPADELNLVTYLTTPVSTSPPKSYGFPDCTTLWNPSADPVGSPQYVGLTRGEQISLNLATIRNDTWCRTTPELNQPPALSFQVSAMLREAE